VSSVNWALSIGEELSGHAIIIASVSDRNALLNSSGWSHQRISTFSLMRSDESASV
jgi:hypothetical protein